jgi:hypothetical protein
MTGEIRRLEDFRGINFSMILQMPECLPLDFWSSSAIQQMHFRQ